MLHSVVELLAHLHQLLQRFLLFLHLCLYLRYLILILRPTDEKGKPFKNIVYEYNLAQALADGKYVKIPTVAKRRNFQKGDLSSEELDVLKLEDAIVFMRILRLILNYTQRITTSLL